MKKLICILLCFILTFPLSGSASSEVFCTVANDKILDITKNTMPFRRNGQVYVPYTVFENGFGINIARNTSINSLVLYNFDYTLTYDLSKGTVFDEQLSSYSYPAINQNGTVYVSLKQVSTKFGIYSSVIPSLATVIRIAKKTPSLSDKNFMKIALPIIDEMVRAYNNSQNQIIQPEKPLPDPEPNPDVTAPQTKKPSKLYLNFDGALNANTNKILKTLNIYNLPATFFILPEDILKNDDLIREIFARGHRIGILLTTPDRAILNKANDDLDLVIGTKTRLVKFMGTEYENIDFEDILIWNTNYNAKDTVYGSTTLFNNIKKYLASTRNVTTLSLTSSNSTASAMKNIAKHIKSEKIYTNSIYDSDKPRQS